VKSLFLIWLFGCGGEPESLEYRPVQRVQVQAAQLPPTVQRRELYAVLRAAKDSTVSAVSAGLVRGVPRRDGDVVKKGQVIVRFDARNEKAQVEAAKAAQADARAARRDAELALENVRALGDGASTNDLARAEIALERAQAAERRADANHELAEVAEGHTTVDAPFDGFVSWIGPEEGEFVAPGAPVARVVDASALHLELGLLPDEVRAARDGRLQVTVGRERFEGRVVELAMAADPMTRDWRGTFEVSTDAGLPGEGVAVFLGVPTEADAAVPPEALRSGVVWVVEAGELMPRPVELVGEADGSVLVRGLDVGQEFVVYGPEYLEEGPFERLGGAP